LHDRGVASFFMNRKLFTKVFLSISFVSFLGIFALMAAHQQYFQRTMLDNELKQVQRAINQAALNLDNRLNRIVNSMYYFFFLFGRRDQTFDRRFGR
jgi:two-component system sensor histidine kinase YesM